MTEKRIAIVTGSAKGIGKAIVKRLIEDNYFIIAVDIDDFEGARLLHEFGQEEIIYINCDITDEKQVQELFHRMINAYTKLDLLINNAGIIKDDAIWNMSIENFDLVIDVNLKGTWIMCREAAKIFKEQKKGRIVNISSRAWLGNFGQSNYAASKAGVVALTRVLALELGKYNVLVNAVAPGLIDTPLTQKLEQHVLKRLIEAQPTKTMGSTDDVAHVVSFLASDQTRFITGQTIYVDGGKSIGAGI